MHTYPLLTHIAHIYKDIDLKNVLLLTCQHLLNPQKKMFELLLQLGLRPKNCVIVGKNYSTNTSVMKDLISLGCIVAPFSDEFEPAIPFDVWFEYKLQAFIMKELSGRDLKGYSKIIVLDDGGFMHTVVNKLCADVKNIIGVEQTSSGHRRIEAANIKFKSISVARSQEKLLLESPHIAQNVCSRVDACLRRLDRKKSTILVSGLGYIGNLVGKHLHKSCKYKEVAGYDLALVSNHNRRIINYDEVTKYLSRFDVIIGASGYPAFDELDLEKMHQEVILISASSSDREFPASHFLRSSSNIHRDSYLDNRLLVNGGFPITFDGQADASPPAQIEFTIALLFINVIDCAIPKKKRMFATADVVLQVRSLWNRKLGVRKWWNDFNKQVNKEIHERYVSQNQSPF